MSNYTKITDFTAKDNLASGDPDKIVKGQLFQDEFDSISESIESKVELGDIGDPIPPVIPKIIVRDRTTASRELNGVIGEFFELEPVFYSETIIPNSPMSKVRVSYQIRLVQTSVPFAINDTGYIFEFRVRLTNNDTNESIIINGENVHRVERTVKLGSEFSGILFDPNIIQLIDVTEPLGSLVGSSSTGYKFSLEFAPILSKAGRVSAVAGSMLILEEIL